MKKQKKPVNRLNETMVREVRVNYVATSTKQFKFNSPETVADFVRSVLVDNSREHFFALFLNAANVVVGYSLVALGSSNHANVHLREILQRALIVGSVSIVVSHNHPSNDITPSTQDAAITKAIREGCSTIGLSLLDHVVVTEKAYFSFRESRPELFNDQ
jgi:DNA repair protein RadC